MFNFRYSISSTELNEHISCLRIPELSTQLTPLLDDLVKDKSLQTYKKENDQGTTEVYYEWTAKSLLEYPVDVLVEIMSCIFPNEQELREKLLQSVRIQ